MVLEILDCRRARSVTARLRRKRFDWFLRMIEGQNKVLEVLDVGGTEEFWMSMGFDRFQDCHITLLNRSATASRLPNVTSVVGDARELSEFEDNAFDIVFSNSVIEHVGDSMDQRRMADEIRRVGKAYYVQTPNRYFPVEPHFQTPFFQFMPEWLQVWLLSHFSLGFFPRAKDKQQARYWARGIHMLNRKSFQQLFADGEVVAERFCGFCKSFIAIRWLSAAPASDGQPAPQEVGAPGGTAGAAEAPPAREGGAAMLGVNDAGPCFGR